MREACTQVGAPADLVQMLPGAVDRQDAGTDAASGSDRGHRWLLPWSRPPTARAPRRTASASGNAVHVVDETADLADAATAIVDGEDLRLRHQLPRRQRARGREPACTTTCCDRLVDAGGYLCDADGEGRPAAADVAGRRAHPLARRDRQAGHHDRRAGRLHHPRRSHVPDRRGGRRRPGASRSRARSSRWSLAAYRYDGGIDRAVELVNAITGYQGLGHTCGIHTTRDDHVDSLANGTRTARVWSTRTSTRAPAVPATVCRSRSA